MSQIRLYIDEDSMKQALVVALRNASVDVMTASLVNRTGYVDEEQLVWATEQGRVLYSANIRDFCRIHSTLMGQGESHAGIVLVQQQRYSVGNLLKGLLKLIATKSAEEMVNQIVFLRGASRFCKNTWRLEIAATKPKSACADCLKTRVGGFSLYSPRLPVCGQFATLGCSRF